MIIAYKSKGWPYMVEVDEVDIQTDKGITAVPIPAHEGTQGWRITITKQEDPEE